MAKCIRCGKFKFFWQLDVNQVCPDCAYAIKREQEELRKEAARLKELNRQAEIRKAEMKRMEEERKKAESAARIQKERENEREQEKRALEEERRKSIADYNEDMNMILENKVDICVSDRPAPRRLVSEMSYPHIMNITRATNISKLFPLVFIDVETTGLNVRGDSIIEVSAIRFDENFNTPTSCFTILTKPKKSIPASATAINGITNEMVKDAPECERVADAFSEYISGCNIVGHNLPFDMKFLFCAGVNFPEKSRYYDTLELADRALEKYADVMDFKLDSILNYFGIYRDNSHRSLSDCFATSFVFRGLIYLLTDKKYGVIE